MSALIVHEPGLLTTVQDLGRRGHASVGVSTAGAADTLALRIANRLVANPDTDAGLEITLSRAEFSTTADTRIAIAGPSPAATIDGRAALPLRSITLRAGERLVIDPPRAGVRTYVAFAGGIRTTPVLASRATHATTSLGAHHHRPLKPGDELPFACITAHEPTVDRARFVELLRTSYTPRLRTLDGNALACTVDPRSDRTGVRLMPDTPLPPSEPIDPEPMHPGGIQHTPDGALVALGPDAATTGGYPVIATVALVDMPALAQLRPHTRCTLSPITIDEAVALLRTRERLLDEAIPPTPPGDA